MPFKTEKQRKAFFAQKGKSKSGIVPSISGKIEGIKEKLRLRRERLGRERIEKEKIILKHEQEQAERLRKEAKVEAEREAVTQKRIQAQREIKAVEQARFERKIAPIKEGIRRTGEGIKKAFEAERRIERAFKKR